MFTNVKKCFKNIKRYLKMLTNVNMLTNVKKINKFKQLFTNVNKC